MLGFIKITKKNTKYFKTIKLQNIKNINLFFHDNKVAAALKRFDLGSLLLQITHSCNSQKND